MREANYPMIRLLHKAEHSAFHLRKLIRIVRSQLGLFDWASALGAALAQAAALTRAFELGESFGECETYTQMAAHWHPGCGREAP